MGINWTDFVILLLMMGGLALGFRQGLVRQLIGLLALYFGGILAVNYYRPLAETLHGILKTTPGTVLQGVAYFVVLLVIMLLINGLTYEAYKSTHISIFPTIDRLTGALFGMLNMGLFIMLALMPLNYMVHAEAWASLDGVRTVLQSGIDASVLVRYLNSLNPVLIGTIRPWLPAGLPSIFDI